MSKAHSTVTYVEPNISIGIEGGSNLGENWHKDDGYDRAPRLEDYCIAFNIEVEVSSREVQGQGTSTNKDVIIMQWNGNSPNSVNFMGGTKIGGYDINGTTRSARIPGAQENLTTYYADMYVGDLIDYGTTEMIGVKSVNIEYEKSCVPIITVQFTDVRGLSLFQPTELSRDNTYNGIKGLNRDNVAQSFFQCFFKMPLPKFTIYIKGFYGNPVSYVVMCDKFDTNFNSETGDFDVTARFIGYNYSFMTDISLDAIIAAPYADFGNMGKRYWDDNVKNGRFFLWDKLKTAKQPMPTLYEVQRNYQKIVNETNEDIQKTPLTEEEITHEEEISKLNDIKKKYVTWYEQLFNVLKVKYGKRYCFDFKYNNDKDWYRILILTNNKTLDKNDLSFEYKQFPDEFKRTNDNLYASIEEFNKEYRELENISKDFSKYTRVSLFNECYVNRNTRNVEFGGFSKENTLDRVQVVNRLFRSNGDDNNESLKNFTLSTIYNNGNNQYIDAYVIEVDYSDIQNRINYLNKESKKSTEERESELARSEYNRVMMDKLGWYPSVENFTKIMLAHLETYMMMMYKVSDECLERTPKDMGISIGKDGIACDVNTNSNVLPPFPRVTKTEIDENNTTIKRDTWVGEFEKNGGKRFIEADLVDSLFNAVDYIQEQSAEDRKEIESSGNTEETIQTSTVKYPLTSFDFHLTKTPYGSDANIANDPNTFVGMIAMRMFSILALSNFRNEYVNRWSIGNPDFVKTLGEIEADNFYEHVKINNEKLLEMIGVNNDESSFINPMSIISCVKDGLPIEESENIPWKTSSGDTNLFNKDMVLAKYKTSNKKTLIFPLQDVSFSGLSNSIKKFENGKIDFNNGDIAVSRPNVLNNYENMLKNENNTFYSVIFSDDFDKIQNILNTANSVSNNGYSESIYSCLNSGSTINDNDLNGVLSRQGVFKPRIGLRTAKKRCFIPSIEANRETLFVRMDKNTNELMCQNSNVVEYEFDDTKVENYITEAKNKDIKSWFISECYGFEYDKEKGIYKQNKNNSFFLSKVDDIVNANWEYDGNVANKKAAFFLMGIDAIDYSAVANTLGKNNTFVYLPKLAVLQIGAALTAMPLFDNLAKNEQYSWGNGYQLMKKLPLPSSFTLIGNYINSISDSAKIGYIRYFRDWVAKNISKLNEFKNDGHNFACTYKVDNNNTRGLFREDSEATKILTNELMSIVCVTKGTIFHYKDVMSNLNNLAISITVAKNYLEGFLERTKLLYGSRNMSRDNSNIRIAKEPTKTNDDMKRELYRYLKLVYDKWIPSTDRKNWEYETFFTDLSGSTSTNGHLFHFIDSYYNKIGDKLLVNPKTISESVSKALGETNVNTMMLGFMADIYGMNKCMLLSIQNFQDLSNKTAMSMMFKPIPYNSMGMPQKHPDFVVVYPYEPSKNLNIDNSEYNNDSFMLNDEMDTPLPIRSRGNNKDSYYQMPAFGVSYGKQYQNYFKKVNVGMASPIATQPALQMKHNILRNSTDSTSKGVVAQDLYDIYTNMSFTCTVEMMGCAWIQPLMYFVLTNVPMFRGSYMILKVKHTLTPGNMTTEFQGTRMSNVSNKLVDEIFTDEEVNTESYTYEDTRKYEIADVSNDCQYKTYPIFEASSKDETERAISVMKILEAEMTDISNETTKHRIAAGLAGNMVVESQLNPNSINPRDNGAIAAGLVQWNDNFYNLRNMLENEFKEYGHKNYSTKLIGNGQVENVRKQLLDRGTEYQCRFLIKSMRDNNHRDFKNIWSNLASKNSASAVAEEFCRSYEKPASGSSLINTRMAKADEFYNAFISKNVETSNPNQSTNDYKSFVKAFGNALVKTLHTVGRYDGVVISTPNKFNMVFITTKNNKNLDLVFDIVLNAYYDYVQKLYWIYSPSGLKNPPIKIGVILSQNPKPNERNVIVCEDGKSNEAWSKKFGKDGSALNKSLLMSIYKKYKTVPNAEIPQFDNQEIFKEIDMEDCNKLVNSKAQTPSKVSKTSEGCIDGWNVGVACTYLVNHAAEKSQHKCAAAVEDAIAKGGGPLAKRMHCGGKKGYATNLRYLGILKDNGFVMIDEGMIQAYGNPNIPIQAGDVAVIGYDAEKQGGKFHVCMYSGSIWASDFIQKNMNPYGEKWPYAIYRFHNKQIGTC